MNDTKTNSGGPHPRTTAPAAAGRRRTTPAPRARTTAPGSAAALARLQIQDLFGSREAEIARLSEDLFAAWLAHRSSHPDDAAAEAPRSRGRARGPRPLSARSIETYRVMWDQFAQFCRSHDIPPDRIDAAMLEQFVSSRRPRTRQYSRATPSLPQVRSSVNYGLRLLRLVQSVLAIAAARNGQACNSAPAELLAREPYRWVDRADKQAAPEVLRDSEVAQLVQVCSLPLGEQHACAPARWSDVRDNTAALLLLGTGLAPGELRALRTGDLDYGDQPLPARLRVRRGKSVREVPLSQDLSRALAYWLACRAHLGLPLNDDGPLLVANDSGLPWPESSMLDAMPRVFARAGIGRTLSNRGGYVLRHTFILRALKRRRMSPQLIAWQLGLKDVNKLVARYSGLALE